GNDATPASVRPCSALELLVAFAVIAAALLDPFQAAIGVGGLVGVVLIDAGVHPRLAGGLLGIFRIHGRREHRGAGRRCGGRRGGGFLLRLGGRFFRCRRRGGGGCGGGRGGIRSAFGFAEIIPLLAGEGAGGLGGLILRTAFLRGQGLRRRCRGERRE